MKDINELLSSLITGKSEVIVVSPKTIKGLIKQGAQFDKSISKTTEELISNLFDVRKAQALKLKIYTKFPEVPDIATPTITSIYDEIRECILMGLNGAAISLSAVLVEYSLKHAIVKFNNGNLYDKNEWDKIEDIELSDAIVKAKTLGILNEIWVKLLNDFKDQVRNPYLHYNIKKITKNVVAEKARKVNLTSQEVSEEKILAENNPIVWTLAKKFVDKEYVIKAFCFADDLMRPWRGNLRTLVRCFQHATKW